MMLQVTRVENPERGAGVGEVDPAAATRLEV
jgi:hypothetical protein